MALSFLKKVFGKEEKAPFEHKALYEAYLEEYTNQYQINYMVKMSDLASFKELKVLNLESKIAIIKYGVEHLSELRADNHITSEDSRKITAIDNLFPALVRPKLDCTPHDVLGILELFRGANRGYFGYYPVTYVVKQLQYYKRAKGITEDLEKVIAELLSWEEFKDSSRSYYGSDIKKVVQLLKELVHDGGEGSVLPYQLEKDQLGALVNAQISGLSEEEQNKWFVIFYHCLKATSGKPSQKFLKEGKLLFEDIKKDNFKATVREWFNFISHMKSIESVHHYDDGSDYTWSTHEFLKEKNNTLVKGLVWLFVQFHDTESLRAIGSLCERAFEKIPGVGPAAGAVGNACVYTLANSRGLDGVGQLSRLKLKIKQNQTKKLIAKYLEEASAKLNITPDQIEEMAVPDFDLVNGERSVAFDDYQFKIKIEKVGKISQTYLKPNGDVQKTVPAFIKQSTKLSEKLKKLKAQIKDLQKNLSAHRDRLDRMFVADRVWDYESFMKFYFNHGMMSFFTKRLIWVFEDGKSSTAVLWNNDQFEDNQGNAVELTEATQIKLWHPINETPTEVLEWRRRINALALQQPLKQAYREVYMLTDAEVNTKVYSNRMAAHILKQHQFSALASVRGWKYSLMGAYDDGMYNQAAEIYIPQAKIKAEYWINELNSDDEWNDAGIWNFVTTDQVRFTKVGGEMLDLIDVPKLVLSEVMRDVDLFVGVASVGNDPEWNDREGSIDVRDYWQSYSFGDLTELAKTRKAILENLVPKLAIKNVAYIDGKFLIVKGKLTTYKIHIGSTNILMEPNDQYLCIVPSRKADTSTDKLFIPFEGDRGLSIVLSKAMLLAKDDKITDTTITSQISRYK